MLNTFPIKTVQLANFSLFKTVTFTTTSFKTVYFTPFLFETVKLATFFTLSKLASSPVFHSKLSSFLLSFKTVQFATSSFEILSRTAFFFHSKVGISLLFSLKAVQFSTFIGNFPVCHFGHLDTYAFKESQICHCHSKLLSYLISNSKVASSLLFHSAL